MQNAVLSAQRRSRRGTQPMMVARTPAELLAATVALRAAHGCLTLVPTMGALHAGHLSLLEVARSWVHPGAGPGAVAASIFVNPTQFGPSEDLARYPRDEAGDLDKLRRAGCNLAWLPAATDIYPPGDATVIDPAGPALGWEGTSRPGHFRGVATVVAKLFGHVLPDAAVFGEKDWQQLQVIRRMTTDLKLPARVIGAPVVREPDGLAMSSRNRFLTADQRAIAGLLYATLREAAVHLGDGAGASIILRDARAALSAAGFGVDYLALVDADSMIEIAEPREGARVIAAAVLGSVRLLDNIAVAPD